MSEITNDNILDQETLEQIKKELITKKDQIIAELNAISEKDGNVNDEHRAIFPDFGQKQDENAQEIGEYTTNLATEKILESSLRDIINALDRMEKGSYGICKYCNKPIGKKRMLARPVASACVECKTRLQSLA